MPHSKAIPIDLGIQVADGEKLQLAFVGDVLTGSFRDWREIVRSFRCSGVIAFRWQPIEFDRAGERPDSTYEIVDSEWVRQHDEQGTIDSAQPARHFRLNFNAIGCLEVICARIEPVLNPS